MSPSPSFRTFAGVRRSALFARPSVGAGSFGAAVDFDVAVRAGESCRTRARVRASAGVEARSVVVARSMIGAVVEVLVAEEATPALVAEALPGLATRAVHATRMALALAA